MNRQRVIRKVLVIGAWVLVIAGITTLLVAANQKPAAHLCSKVAVRIKGTGEKFYIEEGDIIRQLEKTAGGALVNKPLSGINLRSLERGIEKSQWIRDAELYFDRDEVLHVFVEEREPIARIFATNGMSFYMDSSGHQMPLLDKVSARVPVFTGYNLGRRMNGKDSAFLDEMKQLAWVVYQDPFWSAQVGQVDITFDRKFELIPVVGNHVIRLGDGQGLKDKLQRLLLFYQKVLAKTGFNKYGAVDVQFEGQVIGIRKGTVSTVDSLQLQQNIAELLKKSTLQNVTTDMLPDAAAASRTDTVTSNIPKPVQPAAAPVKTSTSPVVRTNPTPVKPKRAAVQQNTAPPKKTPARITSRQPRAVMPRSSRQEAVNSRQ